MNRNENIKKPTMPIENKDGKTGMRKINLALYGLGAPTTAGGAYALYKQMHASGSPTNRVVAVPPVNKLIGFNDYLDIPTHTIASTANTFIKGFASMFKSKPKCKSCSSPIRSDSEFWDLVPRVLEMQTSDFNTLIECQTFFGFALTPKHIRRVKELHTIMDVNVHAYVCHHLVSASQHVFDHAVKHQFVETSTNGYIRFPKKLAEFVSERRNNRVDHLDEATFGKHNEYISKMPASVYKLVESRRVLILGKDSYDINDKVLQAIQRTRKESKYLTMYDLNSFKDSLFSNSK